MNDYGEATKMNPRQPTQRTHYQWVHNSFECEFAKSTFTLPNYVNKAIVPIVLIMKSFSDYESCQTVHSQNLPFILVLISGYGINNK